MPALVYKGLLVIGTCDGHKPPVQTTGVLVGCDGKTKDNNQPIATVGSIASLACGHTARAVTGSPNAFSQGKPLVRKGDLFVSSAGGTFVAVGGSPDCKVNG